MTYYFMKGKKGLVYDENDKLVLCKYNKVRMNLFETYRCYFGDKYFMGGIKQNWIEAKRNVQQSFTSIVDGIIQLFQTIFIDIFISGIIILLFGFIAMYRIRKDYKKFRNRPQEELTDTQKEFIKLVEGKYPIYWFKPCELDEDDYIKF